MFDKKSIKKIKLDKVRQYIINGEKVFMVKMDGSLIDIESTDMESIFFHSLTGGSFAVYRKKFEGIGDFTKIIKIGEWTLSINHKKTKGGDEYDLFTTGKKC